MLKLAENIQADLKNKFRDFLYFAAFFKITMHEIFLIGHRKQVVTLVLLRQILFTGYQALTIITLMGLALGAIIIIQGTALLSNFGQSEFVYNILISVITKELGPLLTAFIIIARSGTAISTELGNMVVSNEVEALQSIGINPIGYLVVPRVFGVVISLMALTVYLNLAGLLGGYIISSFIYPMSFIEFFGNLLSKLLIRDLIMSLVKSIFFGFVIAIICCFEGLQVQYASTEVPMRTIFAVVKSLTWIIIFDVILTIISYSM